VGKPGYGIVLIIWQALSLCGAVSFIVSRLAEIVQPVSSNNGMTALRRSLSMLVSVIFPPVAAAQQR
jgi:uncharacterized membrane protein